MPDGLLPVLDTRDPRTRLGPPLWPGMDFTTLLTSFIMEVVSNRARATRDICSRIASTMRRVPVILINRGILILTVVASVVSSHPALQSGASVLGGDSGLYFAIAVAVAAMFALVLSLSLIPIQRASEAYGRATTRAFASDPLSSSLLLALAFLSIASLAMPVFINQGLVSAQVGLSAAILMIGLGLAAMQAFARRVTRLIDPVVPIELLSRECKKAISRWEASASHVADMLATASPGDANARLDRYLGWQAAANVHRDTVSQTFHNIIAVGHRALDAGNSEVAFAAVTHGTDCITSFMLARRQSLVVAPNVANPLVPQTDVGDFTHPILEALSDIAERAIDRKDKPIVIAVTRGFGAIARVASTVRREAPADHFAPLAFSPIWFLGHLGSIGIRKDMIDAGLTAAVELRETCHKCDITTVPTEVFSPAIDQLCDLLKLAYRNQDLTNASVIADRLWGVVVNLAERNYYQLHHIVGHTLKLLEPITRLSFIQQGVNLGPSAPYHMMDGGLSGLVLAVARHCQKIDDWRRWHDLIEVDEELTKHLRHITSHIDDSHALALVHVHRQIADICNIHVSCLADSADDEANSLEKLRSQISWYLSFFWASAKEAASLHDKWLDGATDTIAQVAMQSLARGQTRTAIDAFGQLEGAAVEYAKRSDRTSDQWVYADAFANASCVTIYAEAKLGTLPPKMVEMLNRIEKLFQSLDEDFANKRANRLDHLHQRLDPWNTMGIVHDAQSMLRQLLLGLKEQPAAEA